MRVTLVCAALALAACAPKRPAPMPSPKANGPAGPVALPANAADLKTKPQPNWDERRLAAFEDQLNQAQRDPNERATTVRARARLSAVREFKYAGLGAMSFARQRAEYTAMFEELVAKQKAAGANTEPTPLYNQLFQLERLTLLNQSLIDSPRPPEWTTAQEAQLREDTLEIARLKAAVEAAIDQAL